MTPGQCIGFGLWVLSAFVMTGVGTWLWSFDAFGWMLILWALLSIFGGAVFMVVVGVRAWWVDQ